MDVKEKRKALAARCKNNLCHNCVLGTGFSGDFREICLANFENAPDEMIEVWYARAFPETPVHRPKLTREEILKTATEIVSGHREQEYGSPENNFAKIGDFWTAYLKGKGFAGCVTAEDVAVMMILFKVARLTTGGGSADTWIDICGYAACGGEIANHERKTD